MVKRIYPILGVVLKEDKCSVSATNTFLGLSGIFPSLASDFALKIALTPGKSLKWKRIIDEIVRAREVSHSTHEALIQRLGFAQCAVFPRFARCMLQPLYAKLYPFPFHVNLHGRTLDAAKWRPDALTRRPRRVIFHRVSQANFLLRTYASFGGNTGVLGAVLFRRADALPQDECFIDTLLSGKATGATIELFKQTATIFRLGLLAVPLSLFHFRQPFDGQSLIIAIDNNAAIGALVWGQTAKNPAHKFVSDIWAIACSYSMSIWFERAPKGVNIADLLARFGPPSYRALNNEGPPPLNEWLGYANRIYTPLFSPNSPFSLLTFF